MADATPTTVTGIVIHRPTTLICSARRRRGRIAMPSSPEASAPDRRAWLRSMLLIRAFEDSVQQLFMQGLVPGTTHLCQGQEGVSVGAISAMAPDDYLT